jgi:hypothetical protein
LLSSLLLVVAKMITFRSWSKVILALSIVDSLSTQNLSLELLD